jgi:hypothetical protein
MNRTFKYYGLSAGLAVLLLAGCKNPLGGEESSGSPGTPIAGISAATPAIGPQRTDIGTLQQDRQQDARTIEEAQRAVGALNRAVEGVPVR